MKVRAKRTNPLPPGSKSGAPWTPREDAICLNYPLREARMMLPHRSRGSVSTHAYTLRHALDKPLAKDGVPFSREELKLLRTYYPIMKNRELQKKFFPERRIDAICNRATKMGLRKKHLPTSNKVMLSDHPDLDEMIRMRARADRIAFRQLDKQLGTGNYFSDGSTRKRKRVNLAYISRAVLFFGGVLIIDWQDR